ncbi:MAG: shikimate dehydrogenase [Clostridiales Family XIII bacterium]|jgi:shikimate dehydrogenase|nr:shikimate dehydrogenase [Clostridiales Family XIII bacterium]
MKNIVLIGLSGSGKSTLGAAVAERFGLDFFDTDAETERGAGMSIAQIFSEYGEARFREWEAAAAQAAARRKGCVIATGGGVILRAENLRALRHNGRVVFLDRPPVEIANDLDVRARPLLAADAGRIHELSRARRERYLACADVCLPCADGLRDAFERLCAFVRGAYPDADFAVIGDPVGHSLSPAIHNAVFAALGISDAYRAIHVPAGGLEDFARRARASRLRGFNVTIPHKQSIIQFLDETDEEARLCGAVNTVRVRDGRLTGYNTDAEGLLRAFGRRGRAYGGGDIAILGAGGAAAGIAVKAAREGARRITIFAGRRPEKAGELARRALGAAGPHKPELVAAEMKPDALRAGLCDADILINATPLGMRGMADDHASLAFLEYLPARALVCDLIYDPPQTKFLREAAARGLETMNGLDMLVAQALLADEIFLGRALNAAALYAIAAAAISRKKRDGGASREAFGAE